MITIIVKPLEVEKNLFENLDFIQIESKQNEFSFLKLNIESTLDYFCITEICPNKISKYLSDNLESVLERMARE